MENFVGDIRWALRLIRRRLAFTTTVVITLAAAIAGAVTAYAVATAVLWKPLPFGDARRLVFVTAFNTSRHLLLGYIFRREEYPWTQSWESYPGDDRIARGLEFATQPFDLPRRDVIQTNSLLDAPTYRWLPAKSKIGSAFLMFYTRTPDGFRKVDDVVLAGGKLTVQDRTSGIAVVLAASRPL